MRAFVFLAKFAEFHYYKSLKQEVHDNLSACVNERSSYALSIVEVIKIWQCNMIKSNGFTKPLEKHFMNFYQGVVLLPKFDNNSPSATRDKEIC